MAAGSTCNDGRAMVAPAPPGNAPAASSNPIAIRRNISLPQRTIGLLPDVVTRTGIQGCGSIGACAPLGGAPMHQPTGREPAFPEGGREAYAGTSRALARRGGFPLAIR